MESTPIRYEIREPRCRKLKNNSNVTVLSIIHNGPSYHNMSDSEPDNHPASGSSKRQRDFETGGPPKKKSKTGNLAAPASVTVKNKLRDIIQHKVAVPKGKYVYEKLESADEIRVLRILKGDRDDKIECLLFPSALASADNTSSKSKAQRFEYIALSYWWGPPDEVARQEINITGPGGDMLGLRRGTFYVRDNLGAALRQLRSRRGDVVIWVDAICINQDDKKEKMAQVSRMHEIYTEAKSVCVWLGAGIPQTKETFDFLGEILDLQTLDTLLAKRKDPGKWWLVVRLLRNAWFSRRWVIQELTLARDATVRWGESQMPWSDFADAIALFMTKHDDIKQILSKTLEYQRTKDPLGDARALGANTLVNATNDLFRKSEDGKIQQRLLPLEVLVSCLFLAFEAKDPRDTIYAVLSISKDTSIGTSDFTARSTWQKFFPPPVSPGIQVQGDIRISPDYDKSIIDVYADFMDYCIETSNSLDILCRHWAPTPRKRQAVKKLSN